MVHLLDQRVTHSIYNSYYEKNVNFSISDSRTGVCQYPPFISSEVINSAPLTLCISFMAFGMGYLFAFINAFRLRKSNTTLTSPVFLGTQKMGTLHGDSFASETEMGQAPKNLEV